MPVLRGPRDTDRPRIRDACGKSAQIARLFICEPLCAWPAFLDIFAGRMALLVRIRRFEHGADRDQKHGCAGIFLLSY